MKNRNISRYEIHNYDEHEIEILEKKKEFESNIDTQRTIDIC